MLASTGLHLMTIAEKSLRTVRNIRATVAACLRSVRKGFACSAACLRSVRRGFARSATSLRSVRKGFACSAACFRSVRRGFARGAPRRRTLRQIWSAKMKNGISRFAQGRAKRGGLNSYENRLFLLTYVKYRHLGANFVPKYNLSLSTL